MAVRPAEPGVQIRQMLASLYEQWWVVTGVLLVVVLAVGIRTLLEVPVYQGTATILIEPERPKVVNIQEVMPIAAGAGDYYQTQYAIIRSRPVVEKVIAVPGFRERHPDLASAGAVLGGLSVEGRRGTRLVLVHFEHPDPRVAAELANAVAASYVRYNLDLKLRGAREAAGWLNEELAGLRTKVEQTSMALQNYRVKSGILGLREQREINTKKIMDLNSAYLATQAQRISAESKLREVTRIAREHAGALSVFTVANAPLLDKLRSEAADLEVQRSRLLKTYKEKHPEVLKVDAQLALVHEKYDVEIKTMLRGIQTEYEVARAREAALLEQVNHLKQEAQDLNQKEIEYLNLQRESGATQGLYETMLKRLKETGITGGLETNNIRIVEEARVPGAPIRPSKTRNLVVSVVCGLLAGVGLAFARDFFDTTMKFPEDVERHLGLPVIAVIPTFGGKL